MDDIIRVKIIKYWRKHMGLFDVDINIDDIVSVIIIEQIQNYRKKSKGGLIFGENILNPNVVFMDGNAEPSGCTYKFSVTFKNGEKKIIKANSGTALCDKLLQKALDSETNGYVESNQIHKKPNKAPELQKNQLPQGIYEVGKDIPAGTFDFHHDWGNGSINVYSAKETILGNLKFFEHVGDTYEYEKVDCVHVTCKEGWYVHISGNLIVSISKSKKIEIDL